MSKVFISYSHDSPEHSARVLEFANALRAHGVDAELDQYHVRPKHGWPHWCAEQLHDENGEFVLLVCTETYRQRVENKVAADEGRGVYREGAIIYDYLYEAEGNRRFIPILLDGAKSDCIPHPIRIHTRYCISAFDLDDDGYQKLYRELSEQPAVVKPPLGETIVLELTSPTLSPLPVREVKTQFASPVAAIRVSLEKLPQSGPNFLGREAELKLLDEAWADAGRTHVVVLVAPGGVGKTTLVKRWLDRLKANGWRGAEHIYGWSFFSQGTSDDRQASDDAFINDTLGWFGVEHEPTLSPWDKGRRLAEAIARSRTLLVLDGLEPLQHPPGPSGGQLRAPGVQALLWALARAGQPGLCVVTTREPLRDLAEYECTADHHLGGVLAHDLGNLDETDGARLLYRFGVTRAGAAAIAEDDTELHAASLEGRGHALALTLLGGYLRLAHGGDIRQRDLVKFEDADEEVEGGKAFRVMDAYVAWLRTSKQNRPLLAVVRLLGLFDWPADGGCLAALRKSPAIAGLTEPLMNLTEAQWNITLSRLAGCGLISRPDRTSEDSLPALNDRESIDTHPLIRTYCAKQLRAQNPQAWRAAHRRLYEHLKAGVPYWPEGLAGLQPLYQAVAHGCKAGLYEEARAMVYRDRILRGTGDDSFFSTKKLGAFGADLGAVACFFAEPWNQLAPSLSEGNQAWLLNLAALRLRALGRLTEALEPMRAALLMRIRYRHPLNAAICAHNLSELELSLGDVAAAVRDAEESVALADRSGDTFQRLVNRTRLADARHQAGMRAAALALLHEAESMQAQHQPEYPFLNSLRGFGYCDMLLSEAERMAWVRTLPFNPAATDRPTLEPPLDILREVEQRAAQSLEWVTIQNWLLDIALDRLTLGRVALYRAILEHSSCGPAREQLSAAVDGLRAAGTQEFIPRSLLSRAWLRFVDGDSERAKADLDEAWQIAERGSMKLYLADILLHRARLFRDRGALDAAARLIEETGYHRRDQELADARTALK